MIKLTDKKRMTIILDILSKEYPDIKIQLNFSNPFELLVATILSAQCTDARVNLVTQDLFIKYKSPSDFLKVEIEELEQDIFSTGFYKAKAKHIRESASKIINDFNGKVPNNMEDLLKLPGVGRKTANVVLGHCFNIPGIVVDTHVLRISNRLEFIETNDAVKIEFALMKLIPKKLWVIFTHYFINHGRIICKSQNPKCNNCLISSYCPSKNKFLK
jgi:endonuclease-3